jgi:hypothetical protein
VWVLVWLRNFYLHHDAIYTLKTEAEGSFEMFILYSIIYGFSGTKSGMWALRFLRRLSWTCCIYCQIASIHKTEAIGSFDTILRRILQKRRRTAGTGAKFGLHRWQQVLSILTSEAIRQLLKPYLQSPYVSTPNTKCGYPKKNGYMETQCCVFLRVVLNPEIHKVRCRKLSLK